MLDQLIFSAVDGVIVSPLYVIFKCNDLLFSEYEVVT